MMSGIDAIVTKHFKLFFRDVADESGDEVHCRNTFGNFFVIFVSGVVEGNIFPIVAVNTGRSNHRPPKVSADIFDGNGRGAEIRLCADIKTIGMIFIDIIFNSGKGRTKFQSEFFEKDFSESIAEKGIVEMFHWSPWSKITRPAFRNESVDMWIPF